MAGIKHDTVGTQLTQTEWEAADSHHITDLIPEADDTYDLGSATLAWQDLFLEGDITMTDAGTIATSAGALTITSAAAATWSTSAGALTITSAAALNLNPASGSAIVLDGTISVDAGVVTNATSITSTAFAGDITGDVTGNADTATALATARNINGVSFDGTANITVTAAGTTLSDTVPVSKGGTNATTLADKAVLITQDTGTDTVAAAAMTTSGQILIGGSSGPAVATLTAGSNVTITNGDGSISIAASATDATNSAHVLVTDNESTNEENLVTFVEDATNSTGNVGLEMDGNLTYNPSSGTLTATAFAGNITGTLTGNATGTAATVTGGTQAAITTLANLTTVGALGAGTITSGFTSIDVGSGTIDTTGAVSTGDLSPAGDVAIADAKVIKLGGARPADDEPASNNTGYGIVVLFDAGAAVAVGDAVSVDTNGRVIKTVADATGTLSGPCIGIATTAAGSADDDVYVMTHGIFRHDDWGLTAGSAAFVEEDDPGDLSATAPNDDGDYVQRVGVAVKDDVLLVMPSIDVIEHTGA